MDILKLVIVFAVMLILVARKLPLMIAAPIAAVVCWILFQIPLKDGFIAIGKNLTKASTIRLLLMMYAITFMQSMLKKRDAINQSQKALTRLFHNNWVTCTVAPFIVGLLPAAPAVIISGDIIQSAVGDGLQNEQTPTAASFFRHISEAFMPTYSAILTALALTNMQASKFVIGMLPEIAMLEVLGMFFLYRGKVPAKAEGVEESVSKAADVKDFFLGMWPLLAAIVMIVGFSMNVLIAIVIVIIAYFFIGHFTLAEIKPFWVSSFDKRTTLNTLAVFLFQAILLQSNVVSQLPDFFAQFPIPTFLVFVLICFFGAIVAGSLTMTTTMVPIAFSAIPNGGYPLLCLLMSCVYAAMQISPTHICLTLSCEHFGVQLSGLIKHTLPIIACFLVFACLYYLGWSALIA